MFKKERINLKNIKFIDAISHKIKDVKNTPDCTFISSPEAITELSIVVTKHLEFPFDYVIFDSVTNLLTYADENTVKKFIEDLAGKVSESSTCKAAIFALSLKEHKSLIKTLETFVDKVIDI